MIAFNESIESTVKYHSSPSSPTFQKNLYDDFSNSLSQNKINHSNETIMSSSYHRDCSNYSKDSLNYNQYYEIASQEFVTCSLANEMIIDCLARISLLLNQEASMVISRIYSFYRAKVIRSHVDKLCKSVCTMNASGLASVLVAFLENNHLHVKEMKNSYSDFGLIYKIDTQINKFIDYVNLCKRCGNNFPDKKVLIVRFEVLMCRCFTLRCNSAIKRLSNLEKRDYDGQSDVDLDDILRDELNDQEEHIKWFDQYKTSIFDKLNPILSKFIYQTLSTAYKSLP